MRAGRSSGAAFAAVLGAAAAIAALAVPAAQGATVTVDTVADNKTNDGLCTLREAVDAVNTNAPVNPAGGEDCPAGQAAPSVDTIALDDSTYSLTGASGDNSNASGDLDVQATGGPLEFDGVSNQNSAIDANEVDRVIDVIGSGPGSLTLRDVALADGTVTNARGAGVNAFGATVDLTLERVVISEMLSQGTSIGQMGGAAAAVGGNLSVSESTIGPNNLVNASGSGSGTLRGGGILASGGGEVTIDRSTFTDNAITLTPSQSGAGGALAVGEAEEAMTITGSTFEANVISGGGGEQVGGGVSWLDSADNDTLRVENSTFAENTVGAGQNGGGLHIDGGIANAIAFSTFGPTTPTNMNGAGYYSESASPPQVRGSLLATNTDDDCNTGQSLGHNVERLTPGTDCFSVYLSSDTTTSLPVFQTTFLEDWGGPTETLVPSVPPVTLDGVPAASCLGASGQPLTADQRGAPRPSGPGCEPGAWEVAFCEGVLVNRVGTGGNDTGLVAGTPNQDGILGLGGDDQISPGSDQDAVCAGEGDDTVTDNDADDDVLRGEGGTDTFTGGPDSELIDLAAGVSTADAVDSDSLGGFENASGGFGNDVLVGDAGPNTLSGGQESDKITGNGGADSMTGGIGTDQLFARDGTADTIDCGDGADTAQTDRASVEVAVGCETVDALAEPVFPKPAAKKPKCKKGRKLKKVKGKFKCVKKRKRKK